MQVGFCTDKRRIRSYGVTVRSVLDAATAYKVARSVGEDPENMRELRLLVRLPFTRIDSVNFIKEVMSTLLKVALFGHLLVLHRNNPQKRRAGVACIPGIFRSYGSGVPRLIHFGELWWLRPQGSRKH